jgi:hypothetical protein
MGRHEARPNYTQDAIIFIALATTILVLLSHLLKLDLW